MSLMMLRPCQKFNAISNLKNPNHNVLAFTGKSICEMQWCEVTASSEIFLTHGLWLWSRGADCINPRILRTACYRKAAQWLKNNSADIVWKNVPASLCKSFEWGIFSSDADLSGWAVVHTATTKVLVYYFFPSMKSCWSAMGLRSSHAKKWCDWKQSISNSRDTNRWRVYGEKWFTRGLSGFVWQIQRRNPNSLHWSMSSAFHANWKPDMLMSESKGPVEVKDWQHFDFWACWKAMTDLMGWWLWGKE